MDYQIDAFPVDDTRNGIQNTEKIKVLICYVLDVTDGALTRQMLTGAMYDNGIANYFELNQAAEELIASGAVTEDGPAGPLQLTERGRAVAKGLLSELSPYIRNKAARVAACTVVYQKRRTENRFTVTKEDESRYRIDVVMSADPQGGEALLRVSLYVTDLVQAERMKTSFYNNPSRLYENVIYALTEDAAFLT